MPIPPACEAKPNGAAAATAATTRGVCRLLAELNYACVTEFALRSGRRLDVLALGADGELLAVEVKVSVADFRGDGKWPEYLAHCETFFFAVPPAFPREILPAEAGVIVADAYGGEILRPAARRPLNGARRTALTRRLAQTAARRLQQLLDPR